MIYDALNRANFRSRLFRETAHSRDLLGIVEESLSFVSMRILAYCLVIFCPWFARGKEREPRRSGQEDRRLAAEGRNEERKGFSPYLGSADTQTNPYLPITIDAAWVSSNEAGAGSPAAS